MSIRKIVGTETELRLDLVSAQGDFYEIEDLVDYKLPNNLISEALVSADGFQSLHQDHYSFQQAIDRMTGESRSAQASIDEHLQGLGWVKKHLADAEDEEEEGQRQQRLGFSGGYTPSGFRLYVDGSHPEISTPECAAPLDLLRWEKAGEWLVEQGREQLRKQGFPVVLYKNNSDGHGNSWGAHENYLVTATLFDHLIGGFSWAHLWATFLATRFIYCGAGKWGTESLESAYSEKFFLSGRAEFISTFLGHDTTRRRPLINTRNISYVGSNFGRRLHVIVGDANRCHWAIYLKVGTAMMVLMMLEDVLDGRFALSSPVHLDSPLSFLKANLTDDNWQKATTVWAGSQKEQWTAVEIQRWFRDQLARWFEERARQDFAPGEIAWMPDVIDRLTLVLDGLAGDHSILYGKIDWLTKKIVLDQLIKRLGKDPRDIRFAHNVSVRNRLISLQAYLRSLEMVYHRLDGGSIFQHLLAKGDIAQLVGEAEVRAAAYHPPVDTRAFDRYLILQREKERILGMSWYIVYLRGEKNIILPSPWRGGEEIHGRW